MRSSRRGRAEPPPTATSPPRTRSSPARSPARSAPAARSPARRSPGRLSKFPARKSPSRVTRPDSQESKTSPSRSARLDSQETKKSPSRATRPDPQEAKKSPSRTTRLNSQDTTKSPSRRSNIKNDELKKTTTWDDASPPPAPAARMTRTRRTEYSIKDLSVGVNQLEMTIGEQVNGLDTLRERAVRTRRMGEEVILRTSTRLKEQTKRVSESTGKSSRSAEFGTDSEEEELPRDKSTSLTRKLATPLRDFSLGKVVSPFGGRWEFGGRVGSVLIAVLLPAWVFAVLLNCGKTWASWQGTQWKLSVDPKSLFNLKSTALFASQVLLQAAVACLPILGRRADRLDDSGKRYCFNALFGSVVSITAIFALDFFKVLSSKWILDEYIKLAVLFYIFAVVLSVVLFIKSRNMSDDKLNPYGNTGYALYDFLMGRELFPTFGRLDFKVLVHRICNVNGLILTLLLFVRAISLPEIEVINLQNYKEAINHLTFNSTLLLFSFLQLVYFLNLVTNEHKITSTFSWQSEGVGYLQCVSSALYPFYFVAISKFVLDNNVSLKTNILVAAAVLYFFGFVICLFSNNIKYEFRRNPLQPRFAKVEAMPTFHGKRLLVSGLWGTVRHPNYVGDIIAHLALAVPGALSGPAVAVLPAMTTVLVLVHRAARDNARCRRRYGAAWQRYCSRVPSTFIPKIY